MRVAIDGTHITGTSGIETYARNIVRGIASIDRREVVEVFTSSGKAEAARKIFHAEPNVAVRGGLPHPLMLGAAARPITASLRARTWRRVARTADMLHFPDPIHFATTARRSVVTVHDIIPITNPEWCSREATDELQRAITRIARHAAGIVVPSQFVREELVRIVPTINERVAVVHEAASEEFRRIAPDGDVLRRLGVRDGEPFFLHIGRLDPRKNIAMLIDAFARSARNIPAPVRLLILGRGDAAVADAFRARAAAGDVGDRVTIHGGADDHDLVHAYNAAVAFVFPSHAEGFGLPAVEAMQCGCPVIAANTTSLPEITGDAALLVDPRDVDAFAAAMTAMATDGALRLRQRDRGLARARSFSWDRAARETLDVFRAAQERSATSV